MKWKIESKLDNQAGTKLWDLKYFFNNINFNVHKKIEIMTRDLWIKNFGH